MLITNPQYSVTMGGWTGNSKLHRNIIKPQIIIIINLKLFLTRPRQLIYLQYMRTKNVLPEKLVYGIKMIGNVCAKNFLAL